MKVDAAASSRPDGSRVAFLRAGTRDAHASIETVPAMTRLLAADLTVGEYVDVLAHMHAFHAAIEPAVAARLQGHPAALLLDGTRPRALRADLDWFAAEPACGQTLARAVCGPALSAFALSGPNLSGSAFCGTATALGALYVVEGSSLGGRVIARHLAASLGVVAGAGGSFYAGGDAQAARARWGALCEQLEATPADPDEQAWAAALLAGARATFQSLECWLRRIDVTRGRLREAASMAALVAAPLVGAAAPQPLG